jgi:hypothetical protein
MTLRREHFERVTGFEPVCTALQAAAYSLSHTRIAV